MPDSHFTNGRWDKLASVMISKFSTTKHHVTFEHASNRFFDIKEKETRNAFQKRAANQSHAREAGIGVQLTVFVVAVKNGFSTRYHSSFSSPATL